MPAREYPNEACRRFARIQRALRFLNLAMLGIFLGVAVHVLGR